MNNFERIAITICTVSFVVFVIATIIDLVKTGRHYNEYKKTLAQLDVYRGALQREHMLLKSIQHYGEWLDTFGGLMATNNRIEPNDYNMGAEAVAKDCLDEFYNTFSEVMDKEDNK